MKNTSIAAALVLTLPLVAAGSRYYAPSTGHLVAVGILFLFLFFACSCLFWLAYRLIVEDPNGLFKKK